VNANDRLINPTAEAALLGGLMLDNDRIIGVADRVKPDDFADALNGRIYSAMLRFAAKGMRADAVTLRPLFASDGDCRYGDYLGDLVEAPAVKGAIDALADQVADLAGRRGVRETLREALNSVHDDLDVPVDAITGKVEASGWAAAARKPVDVMLHAGDLARLVRERAEEIRDNPDAAGMRNALVEDWDSLLNLERGTYNILAGRPGMGKSSLASSVAYGYAINGHPGLVFNHEMSAEQMAIRSTADLAHAMGHRIEHEKLKKGELADGGWGIVDQVEQRGKLLPIRFLTPGTVDVKRVYSLAAQHRALLAAQGRELEFVVVDYLGLLGAHSADGKPLTKGYDRVSAVSRMLKKLAEDLDVALIALAQLSRGVEQRQNKRPILSDLKESGDLEQDADSVTFIYREEYYLEQERPKPGDKTPDKRDAFEEWETEMFAARNKLDLICAKNRHGRVGTRTARFYPEYSACRSGDYNAFDDTADPLLF